MSEQRTIFRHVMGATDAIRHGIVGASIRHGIVGAYRRLEVYSGDFKASAKRADLSIRRDLNLAIARDEELRRREISYIVANGDISVTGVVRTEDERRRMNDLAMHIGAVKSIAALRVAE